MRFRTDRQRVDGLGDRREHRGEQDKKCRKQQNPVVGQEGRLAQVVRHQHRRLLFFFDDPVNIFTDRKSIASPRR